MNCLINFSDGIQSFHLAEGPGGFIEAMIYMRNNRSDLHYGMTLLSEKRNIPKWNKIRSKFKFNPLCDLNMEQLIQETYFIQITLKSVQDNIKILWIL